MKKVIRVYQIILVVCSLFIGTLMCYADSLNKKIDSFEKDSTVCEIGVQVENYILDVIYETDLFDEITDEERDYLYELEEKDYPRYCVELLVLYGKYYGDK